MLILVRHGRTALNATGRLQGRIDAPLDDVGQAQAQAIGAALADLRPARVVSSPLQRARATAEALGAPVEIDERWLELDYGDYDGKALADVPAEVWDRWREDASFRPPGGEAMHECGARVVAAIGDLAPLAEQADVVVVSHVTPIKAAVAWTLGCDARVGWRTHLDHASISRVALTPRGPVLRSFNEVAHLPRGRG